VTDEPTIPSDPSPEPVTAEVVGEPDTPSVPAAATRPHNPPMWVVVTAVAVAVGLVSFLAGWAIGRADDGDERPTAGFSVRGPGGGMPGPFDRRMPGDGEMPGGGGHEMPRMPFGGGPNGGGGSTQAPGVVLGVMVREADSGVAVVRVVAGSPADDAGLEAGDVITQVDGDEIDDAASLRDAIGSHDAGDEVEITVSRDGETKTVTAELVDPSDLSADPTREPSASSRQD